MSPGTPPSGRLEPEEALATRDNRRDQNQRETNHSNTITSRENEDYENHQSNESQRELNEVPTMSERSNTDSSSDSSVGSSDLTNKGDCRLKASIEPEEYKDLRKLLPKNFIGRTHRKTQSPNRMNYRF